MFSRRSGSERSNGNSGRSNETCPVMRKRLMDEIDPVLMEEEGVPVITEKEIETTLRLTRRLYVEWEDEGGIVEVDLGLVMFHNLIEEEDKIGIEINSILPNATQPRVDNLFFKSEEDREKVANLLQKSQELIQKKMNFSEDIVNIFCQRAFHKMKPKTIDDVKKVKKEEIKNYFKRIGMTLPKGTLSEDHCTYEDWKSAYHLMMSQQFSKVLRSVFQHYSVWGGDNEPWKMKPENLKDFLMKHQQESHQYSSEEIANIMRRHKNQVMHVFMLTR